MEKHLQEPPGALLRSFGEKTLGVVCQMTVNIVCGNHDITAKVQFQKGAPVHFLLGSDLLPRLGFSFLKSQLDDTAIDRFHQRQWKRQSLLHPPPQKLPVSDNVITVRLLTATRLPPRHTKHEWKDSIVNLSHFSHRKLSGRTKDSRWKKQTWNWMGNLSIRHQSGS